MEITTMINAFTQIGTSFSLAPFDRILQPLIEEVLNEEGQSKYRKGTVLIPRLLIWLVLGLTLRRDLNYHKALNWLVSGFRWVQLLLPAQSNIVQDGAISHARVRLGVKVFQKLFAKLVASFQQFEPDFHGWVSVAFDGSTGTMPDTEANVDQFNKPKSGRGQAAFPQLRMMTLLAVSVRLILNVAYAPYCGKGTGERALLLEILDQIILTKLLFLLDAGLYAFELLQKIGQTGQKFIVKAPAHVKLKPIQYLSDGSYLAQLTQKVPDLDAPKTNSGRQRWKKVSLMVRVIRFEIPGFRPVTLITNIFEPTITARDIALHYHKRWDIEIAYDEIKTHQCATLKGQSPTIFRSKRPDLVAQELYAMLIMYNLVRLLIAQAAAQHGKDPRLISFLDALQHIIDAAPLLTADPNPHCLKKFNYLLAVIADCDIDRPRRPRINPRVVKVKMSKFKRKRNKDRSENRDIKELKIIIEHPDTTNEPKPIPQNLTMLSPINLLLPA